MVKNGIGNRVMVRRNHSSALSVTGGAGRPEEYNVFLYSKRDLEMQQKILMMSPVTVPETGQGLL
jgi:hypothetical protein